MCNTTHSLLQCGPCLLQADEKKAMKHFAPKYPEGSDASLSTVSSHTAVSLIAGGRPADAATSWPPRPETIKREAKVAPALVTMQHTRQAAENSVACLVFLCLCVPLQASEIYMAFVFQKVPSAGEAQAPPLPPPERKDAGGFRAGGSGRGGFGAGGQQRQQGGRGGGNDKVG